MNQLFQYTDLVLNPDYFLHSVSLGDGQAKFMEVTRDSYTKSSFLDGRIAFTRNRRHSIDLAQLMQMFYANPVQTRPVHFIFHISFCCSTLLSRGLNLDGRSFSLREPYALIDLAHFKRSWGDTPPIRPRDWQALVNLVLTLLAKSYRDDDVVLIKPSNLANALIEDILELRPEARAILMYCSLESFVVGNLKKTEETKEKIWWLARMFSTETDILERVPGIDIGSLSHVRVVALLWHMQMYRFLLQLQGPDAKRLKSLDCEQLLDQRVATLAAACDFLGFEVTGEELEQIAAGAVFSTHAKNPFESYGKEQRDRENEVIAATHRAEIDDALAWSGEKFNDLNIPTQLPSPLLGSRSAEG